MITLSLGGFEKLQAALKNKEDALIKGLAAEMSVFVADTNRDQKASAPVDHGFLRSSIGFDKKDSFDYNIRTAGPGSSYAAYQEFGTGGLVSIPAGLEVEATRFKGAGIRKVNMKAQPFFFGNAFRNWDLFIKKVKDLLK